jgi:hypothetical protein
MHGWLSIQIGKLVMRLFRGVYLVIRRVMVDLPAGNRPCLILMTRVMMVSSDMVAGSTPFSLLSAPFFLMIV